MTELDPRHKALLEQFRADEDPGEQALEAVLNGVLSSGPAAATAGPTPTVLKLGLVTAVVVAAAAALSMRPQGPSAGVEPAGSPAPAQRVATTQPEDPGITAKGVTVPPQPEPSTAPTLPAEPVPKPRSNAAKRSRSQAQSRPRGVAEEVALMGKIRRALQDGNGKRALNLSRRHEAEFPRGVFVDEREVSMAEALCSTGQQAKGRRIADAFVAAHPRSPFAPRAQRACVTAQRKPGPSDIGDR